MVAAPETQQQQQQEVPATGHAHGQGLKSTFSKENVGKESENEEKGSVNGLAVVDGSDQSSSGATHNLPPPDVARNIPCRFFPLGTCKYGEQCIFSHGIPGVAGSPGVPPSPSVQPQVAPGQSEASQSSQQVQPQFVQNSVQQHQFQPQHHHHQHQQMMDHQQVVPSMEQAYMQGMPMYYPEQALQYGFQPPFSPEQAYYHFAPPPFQAYPQHYQQFTPHAYYPPPPPASSVPHLSAAAQAQNVVSALPTETSPTAPSPVASPSQPTQNASSSPLETAAQQVPPVAQQHTFPVPRPQELSQGYPSNGGAEGEEQTVDPSSPSLGLGSEDSPLSRAPASLHTFFQTSSPMPPSGSSTMTTAPLPVQPSSNPLPPAAISNSPNGFVKPLPGRLAGPRRSIGGVPTGPYSQGPGGMNGGKRRSFGGTRPPCSFFEANRCKNGDECSFVHLLQDGTDARALGRGMIGSDGRTDSPEATGGMPPAWLMNQKALRFAGGNGAGANGGNLAGGAGGGKKQLEGGAIMNGGYSYRERGNGPVQSTGHANRGRYEEDQQARYATRQQFQPQVQMMEGQAQNHFPQALPQQPQHQQQPQNAYQRASFVNGSLAGRIPPGGTPQLVAAINGLTRRIPPAQTSQAGAPMPQDASEGEAVTETPSTLAQGSTPASREPSQQRVPTVNDFPALGSPAAPLSPNVEKESYTSAVDTPVAAPKEEESKKEVASSPVEENDGFVMVSHQDASPSSPSAPPTASATPPTASEPPKSSSSETTPVPASSAPPPQTSTAPPSRPAQPPKLMVSFASIAKAASGPSVAEKTKPKSTPSAPVQQASKAADQSKPSSESVKTEKKEIRLEDEAKNDDGFVTKTSKKSKKTAARTPSTQVSIKV